MRMSKRPELASKIKSDYWSLPGHKRRNYCTEASRKYGVSRNTIYNIVAGKGAYEDLEDVPEERGASVPTSTALALIRERNIFTCQVCGVNPAEEAHHCLYGKKKGVVELNWYENLQLVCVECHRYNGRALTFENRLNYWKWACDFYGHKHMVEWHEDLPLVIKEKAYK